MSLLPVALVCLFAPAPFVRPLHSYIGIELPPRGNDLSIASVFAGSPAEKAGLQMLDVLVAVDGKKLAAPDDLERLLRRKKPGNAIVLAFRRDNVEQAVRVTLANRRPTPYLGVSLVLRNALTINIVADNSPASEAGLQVRDVVLNIDGGKFSNTSDLAAFLRQKKPGDVVTVALERGGRAMQVKVKLGTRPGY
jgi:S1-C subfamily serine protease